MANSILKLKVESSEYDQKLANAAKGIRHLADVAHKSAGELTGLEKSEVDYIKALGDMETKSRTASGQVRELSSTYKELKVIYDQLNEVEKADEGGKALAASLETLRTRAQEAKTQLDSATQSLNDNGEAGKGTSGILEVLKDKFTVNIDAVKLFNMGLQAAETALNVAKDAFFNNEEQLDEWGRVVESSHSLYTGFLNALNTGDIIGYLSNINQIVQAARDAYDALDALGTYNAFNQINVERTRTNMTESIADYRGGKGTKETVKAAGEAYKKELQDRKRLENEAYLAAVKRVAAERGVSAKDLTDALSGTYGHYQDLKNVQPTGVRQTVVGSGMFARIGTETFAQNRQEKLGEALRHLNDTELQSLQALGAQAQRTGNEIAQVDKQLTRVLNGRQIGGGSTGGKGGNTTSEVTYASDSIVAQQKLVQDLAKKWNEAGADVRDQYLQPLVDAEAKLKEMQNTMDLQKTHAEGKLNGVNLWQGDIDDISGGKTPQFAGSLPDLTKSMQLDNLPQFLSPLQQLNAELEQLRENLEYAPTTEAYQEGLKAIADKQKEIASFKGIDLSKDADKSAKSFQAAAGAISQVGSALNSIEDPTAKILGIIAQAIASVASGAGQAVSAKDTTSSGWAWIGAAAAITASMVAMISQIHSATGYAQGGIVDGRGGGFVGGMSYSGDNIGNVRLDSGELVLNRAQQTSLANQLQSSPMSQMQLSAVVTGEQIRLVLNNNGRRTGRGEYVTTNFT